MFVKVIEVVRLRLRPKVLRYCRASVRRPLIAGPRGQWNSGSGCPNRLDYWRSMVSRCLNSGLQPTESSRSAEGRNLGKGPKA